MTKEITLLVHNIRSTYNVGALFRTAEGFGVKEIIISGYTPYPDLRLSAIKRDHNKSTARISTHDPRLPHIIEKLTAQIHKTALGAETLVPFRYCATINEWLEENVRTARLPVIALEQNERSTMLNHATPPEKFALLIGEEVHGIMSDLLVHCDSIIEIPMHGQKESFNVSVATGIALYGLMYPSASGPL